MDTKDNTASADGEARMHPPQQQPFGSRHAVDMMVGARDQLFVISALADQVEKCSENCFNGGNAEEAAVLLIETTGKLAALLDEVHRAIDFLRAVEDGREAV